MVSKSDSGMPGAPQQHHRPPACPLKFTCLKDLNILAENGNVDL